MPTVELLLRAWPLVSLAWPPVLALAYLKNLPGRVRAVLLFTWVGYGFQSLFADAFYRFLTAYSEIADVYPLLVIGAAPVVCSVLYFPRLKRRFLAEAPVSTRPS